MTTAASRKPETFPTPGIRNCSEQSFLADEAWLLVRLL
jgi:hypothetical protein